MKLLFVCLGNICRSPAAEESIRVLSTQSDLQLESESCGVGKWHIGKPAFQPMIEAAKRQGLDLSNHRARCIQDDDFTKFDYLVAMDQEILAKLQSMAPLEMKRKIVPFLIDLEGQAITVPDPYYTKDFEAAMSLILKSRQDLIDRLLFS